MLVSLGFSLVAFAQPYLRVEKGKDESNAGLLVETIQTLKIAVVRNLKQIRLSIVGKHALCGFVLYLLYIYI